MAVQREWAGLGDEGLFLSISLADQHGTDQDGSAATVQVLGFRLWTPLRPSQLAVPLVVGASALGGTKSRKVGMGNMPAFVEEVARCEGFDSF